MTDLIFKSTADIADYFITLQNAEDENSWQCGDALVAAVNQGYKLRPLYNEVLKTIVQKSYSTLSNQWRTSTIFPEDRRAAEKCWSDHRVAAKAVKHITRKQDYALAWDWLDRAIAQGMTTDKLEDFMAGKKADVHKSEPIYLCKRIPATIGGVTRVNGVCAFTISVAAEDAKKITSATDVLLTMFIPAEVDNVNLDVTEAAAWANKDN